MENTETQITLNQSEYDVIYQQDKAMVDTQISTAKAFPRNVTRSVNNAIAIVSLDQKTAATCTYSLPRGGKPITGPSVHLAKILAQVWGNMRVEAKVVNIDTKQVTSQAVAFDLENNLAIKVEVKRSIMTKSGRMSDDMITVTGNAANAIALRNAILAVIPRGVVDKVYESAKQTIVGDLSDEQKLLARRKKVIDGLKDQLNVTEQEACKAVGKPSVEKLNADDLMVLIGIVNAINDGDTTVDEAFRGLKAGAKPEEITVEDLQLLFDNKKANLSDKELKDCQRVIDTKETASFKKIKTLLESK